MEPWRHQYCCIWLHRLDPRSPRIVPDALAWSARLWVFCTIWYVFHAGLECQYIADGILVTDVLKDSHLSDNGAIPDSNIPPLGRFAHDTYTDREVAVAERYQGFLKTLTDERDGRG